MDENKLVQADDTTISSLIYTIRGTQVMLDSDLAMLYQVETRVFNQAVKRNSSRFPEHFRFQLTEVEYKNLRSQFVISSLEESHGGRRYMPYVFTEQGIAMLSAVLRSDVAVEVSIKIMDSFVQMRRFLYANQALFSRLDRVEMKQLETDKKLEEVFDYIGANTDVKQHIFFDGQIYDAFSLMVTLVQKAKTKLMLIDNYIDMNTLNILCKKNTGVNVIVITAGKVA